MATDAPKTTGTKKKKRGGNASLGTWGKRVLIALVAGVSLGAGAGVITVNRLEPGRGTGVDSLAVMLDSIARGNVPAARDTENDESQDDGAEQPADSAATAPAELVAVPSLTDLEEGAARNALLDAGLAVGEIQFQASSKAAGTVLGSVPVAGAKLPPDSPVTLILSDGRPDGADSLRLDRLFDIDAPSEPDSMPDSLPESMPDSVTAADSLTSGRPTDPDTTFHFLRPSTP